jgi:hypothetical protein
MEPLIVINHPEPLSLEARPLEHEAVPEGEVGVGYYHNNALIARSIVTPESIEAIHSLLSSPVAVALAATEDPQGNIDGRLCLVLPIDDERLGDAAAQEENEPWKASVPPPPMEIEGERGAGLGEVYDDAGLDPELPRVVLLPIGNVVRNARDRHHPNNPAFDAREMLDNLLAGAAQDAVAKAIDDLLSSI